MKDEQLDSTQALSLKSTYLYCSAFRDHNLRVQRTPVTDVKGCGRELVQKNNDTQDEATMLESKTQRSQKETSTKDCKEDGSECW